MFIGCSEWQSWADMLRVSQSETPAEWRGSSYRKQQYSNEGTMLYSNEEGDEQKSMLPNNSIIIAPEN